jgi:hypothetical protein
VFAGGGTLDAAEDMCDADLDTVGSLVDPRQTAIRADRACGRSAHAAPPIHRHAEHGGAIGNLAQGPFR